MGLPVAVFRLAPLLSPSMPELTPATALGEEHPERRSVTSRIVHYQQQARNYLACFPVLIPE